MLVYYIKQIKKKTDLTADSNSVLTNCRVLECYRTGLLENDHSYDKAVSFPEICCLVHIHTFLLSLACLVLSFIPTVTLFCLCSIL